MCYSDSGMCARNVAEIRMINFQAGKPSREVKAKKNSVAGWLVQAVAGDACVLGLHGVRVHRSLLESGNYRIPSAFEPRCPTRAGTLSQAFSVSYQSGADRDRTDDLLHAMQALSGWN